MPRLQPCPFCGSAEIRSVPMPLVNGDSSDRRWWVGCANALDHDADTFAPTQAEAESVWNRRAEMDDDTTVGLVMRLTGGSANPAVVRAQLAEWKKSKSATGDVQ